MLAATGVVTLMLGLIGFGGQFISTLNWPLAQRLGLQEAGEHTDPLFRRLERNTAIWDLCSWWTLPLAGLLMLLDHAWWPFVAIFAGGVYADTAGRELAKLWGLGSEGVRTGTAQDARTRLIFLLVTGGAGLWAAAYAVLELL